MTFWRFDPPARVVTLHRSYRSSPEILAAANAVIAEAEEGFGKRLRSDRPAGPLPGLVTVRDEAGQADFVCAEVLAAREAGIALKRQAVLFRAAHHSAPLEVELVRRDIPFVKFGGLEVFSVVERATGGASAEATDRPWNQFAADIVYRFFPREQLYAGLRYNRASGTLAGIDGDLVVDRWQLAAGWFVTRNILIKSEYVNQHYDGFPPTNIRHGAEFHGMMLEGVVAF